MRKIQCLNIIYFDIGHILSEQNCTPNSRIIKIPYFQLHFFLLILVNSFQFIDIYFFGSSQYKKLRLEIIFPVAGKNILLFIFHFIMNKIIISVEYSTERFCRSRSVQ
jgi:hypothetical protein